MVASVNEPTFGAIRLSDSAFDAYQLYQASPLRNELVTPSTNHELLVALPDTEWVDKPQRVYQIY